MKRDKASLEILNSLNESILNEMPKKVGITKKVKGYNFKDLNNMAKSKAKEKLGFDSNRELNSTKDAEERFNQDASLDLQNRLDKIIPNAFSVERHGTNARYKADGYEDDFIGLEVNYKTFVDGMIKKFDKLEITKEVWDENHYLGFHGDIDNMINNAKDVAKDLRHLLHVFTNFDDLRRFEKVEINNVLVEIVRAISKSFTENKTDFEKRRGDYDKYTRASDKEIEQELAKYWYDQNGNVLKAKDMNESFKESHKLREAEELDVDEYIEIYNFDELSDWAKEELTDRRIKLQIQKMFDRMTEILEEKFTEYMSARGLELEPNQFDVDRLLYNMTHKRDSYYDATTSFMITNSELKSYIKNNQDLVEKYSQKALDKLFAFLDSNDNTQSYRLVFDRNGKAKIEGIRYFSYYDYTEDKEKYHDGASKELEQLYNDLSKELSLDFYSAANVLDNAVKQLRDEAKKIVYDKMSKSKDMYLRNGVKFDRSKYNIKSEEDVNEE